MSREQERPKVAGYDPPGGARRNRYFRGKLLTVADYTIEQRYHIERRQLINRTLHGWGVISGFDVEAEEGALQISPGMAFDPQGRELVACAETILERATDMIWLRADGLVEQPGERPAEAEVSYLLCAHYAERGVDGVRIDDGYGDSICEANRICETVIFSLIRRHPPGADREAAAAAAPAGSRGEAEPAFVPCRTGKLSRIAGVDIDLDAPVPLAMVTVKFGPGAGPAFAGVDASAPPRRPLRPTGFKTGGGLEMHHVATPARDPAAATPEQPPTGDSERAAALDKAAAEAEAALQAQERALAEAAAKADSARAEAAAAEDRLRQTRQAQDDAAASLVTLTEEARAAADRLQQGEAARREAEADLARLRAEETAVADARGAPAVTPKMIETAERRIETAKKKERELKAAAERGTTPKMIATAEERAAAAKQEAEEAQQKADAARAEERRRAEARDAAETRRNAAKAAWEDRVRQLEEQRNAEGGQT